MPKTRHRVKERNAASGTFKKLCGAVIHNESDPASATFYNIDKGKKLKTATLDNLFKKQIITKRAKYICHSCVDRVEKNAYTKPTESIADETLISTSCDETPLNSSDYESCIDTAKYLSGFIQSDVSCLYNDKSKYSLANLLGYDPEEWLNERPAALVGLLRKLCGYDENCSIDKQMKIAKIVELIYGCRNSKLILPLSFQENLLIYSVSRNKQLLTYNSKIAPAGSTDTISKWLADEASTPVEFPKGLVRTVFDNEQVIGKTYKIKAENKVPISIVTSHLYICIDPESTVQNEEKFAPRNWLFEKPSDQQKALFLNDNENHINLFRATRNNFISKRLMSVVDDHVNNNYDFVDSILNRKSEVQNEKLCLDCGAENEASSRKCTNCKGPIAREKQSFSDTYEHKKKLYPYSYFFQC